MRGEEGIIVLNSSAPSYTVRFYKWRGLNKCLFLSVHWGQNRLFYMSLQGPARKAPSRIFPFWVTHNDENSKEERERRTDLTCVLRASVSSVEWSSWFQRVHPYTSSCPDPGTTVVPRRHNRNVTGRYLKNNENLFN